MLQNDQRDGDQDACGDLIAEFGTCGQTEIAAMNNLQVIVGEADGAEGQRREDGEPDERVAEVGPKKRGDEDRDGDEQATHGRSAGFFLVGLRAFFADVLSNLEIAETLDDERTDDESGEERGETGECGAESQITEDAEGREVVEELSVEEPVEQSLPRRDFVVGRWSMVVKS